MFSYIGLAVLIAGVCGIPIVVDPQLRRNTTRRISACRDAILAFLAKRHLWNRNDWRPHLPGRSDCK